MIEATRKLQNAVSKIKATFTSLIRVGVITDVDAAKARVKVTLPGFSDLPTDWLTCITKRTLGVRTSFNYKVNEKVLCLFLPFGDMSTGFVLGSFYDDKNLPAQTNPDVFSIEWEDGTVLSYDQGSSTGSLKIKGGTPALTVSPEGITIEAKTSIIGATSITGTLDVSDAVTLANVLNGAMTASFMGTVGAAGYTGPVSGAAAQMNNGANITTTLTYNGQEVTTMPHTHMDAESRPTGSAIQ
ncbi:phage baseplate assembly protein V [Vibrio owensii]|uniref:Phage baseplate assembly protein V n=1 Tax=Vibrio owensii TaxID=696485 RepID=A0AAP9GC03_9VIBR|nr:MULTISPECIES: phage baseplate assembly protein V [Vibrio harveyi group]AYO18091.1 phage baseplate assembly protein V [Vibrio owensii]EHR5319964.1 phage baseplate assembly protein V [Vibrio parahaemolyticus]MBE3866066.1 phage baseplate assembly protein V [Vibrio parahaemolyticus]QGH47265.1 phage baseplate assembly protein V [Vibrio owensii]TOK09505.1 phage baseplate assembly protein V [Vibrio parahaemolyticus]